MPRQADAPRAPSGATALLAGAVSYALSACARVAPGEMALPTPCADWDLAALLAHLAASMADLESAIITVQDQLFGPDRICLDIKRRSGARPGRSTFRTATSWT